MGPNGISTGGAGTITSGVSTVAFNKSLFVAKNGNDGTGQVGKMEFPYLTLAGAKAAASSGDTIFVFPGTYAEKNWLKNGVNWHFWPGVIIDVTGDGTYAIMDDADAVIVCQITGSGNFIMRGGADTGSNNVELDNILHLSRATSSVKFHYNTLQVIDGDDSQGQLAAIRHRGGRLHTRGHQIDSTSSGIWWSSGESFHEVDYIQGATGGINGYAVWSTPGITVNTLTNAYTSGFLWTKFKQIGATNINGIIQTLGTINARVWLQGMEILGDPTAKNGLVNINGNRVYLNLQKLTDAMIQVDGTGQLWYDIQKIAPGLNTEAIKFDTAGSKSWGSVQNIEAANSVTKVVNCVNGDHVLRVADGFSGTGGDGIYHSGGTLRFSGRMDTSAAAAKTPVVLASNGLTLEDATIVANSGAADAITAASAFTVVCNNVRDPAGKGKHSNVTVTNNATL